MSYPRTIKSGSAVVTVYWIQKRYFQVSYYLDGKRKRESRSDEGEALARAKDIADRIAKGDTKTADVTESDAYVLKRARQILMAHGHTLEVDEACREFVRIWTPAHKAATVSQVCTEYLKRIKDSRPKYQRDLKFRLARFTAKFGRQEIRTLEWDTVEKWVETLPARKDNTIQSPRTRSNWFTMLRTIWRYARSKNYLPENHNLFPKENPYRGVKIGAKSYMTTEGLYTLYDYYWTQQRYDMLTFLGVQAFAGMRVEEAKQLKWADIDLHTRTIALSAEAAKKSESRLIPINLTLFSWLQYCYQLGVDAAQGRERIISDITADALLRLKYRELTQLKWHHNQLRHTYLTNACTLRIDKVAVATEAGTSLEMIRQYYQEKPNLVEAVKWFTPLSVDKQAPTKESLDAAELRVKLGW